MTTTFLYLTYRLGRLIVYIALLVGLQAIVISLIARKSSRISIGFLAASLGGIIMVIGYTLGRAFIYSTIPYAIMKLPFQILQALVGIVAGVILVYKFDLKRLYNRFNA